MNSGIYKITSPSGNFYIGSAVNFHKRWMQHRSGLRRNVHHANGLQNACSKYGLENLEFEKTIICAPEHLEFYEQLCLDRLKPKYNSSKVAKILFGSKRPEVSARMMGKRHTPEAISRMKNLSPDQIEARRLAGLKGGAAGGRAGKGKTKSAETRKRCRMQRSYAIFKIISK